MDLRRSGLGLDAPRSGPATRALLSVLLVAALGTLAAPGAGADDGAGLPGPSRPEPGLGSRR